MRVSSMSIVGHVESLWRYPVKCMRGEEVDYLQLLRGIARAKLAEP
jgi:hypothetical protein